MNHGNKMATERRKKEREKNTTALAAVISTFSSNVIWLEYNFNAVLPHTHIRQTSICFNTLTTKEWFANSDSVLGILN